jgi:hypothetical protein
MSAAAKIIAILELVEGLLPQAQGIADIVTKSNAGTMTQIDHDALTAMQAALAVTSVVAANSPTPAAPVAPAEPVAPEPVAPAEPVAPEPVAPVAPATR